MTKPRHDPIGPPLLNRKRSGCVATIFALIVFAIVIYQTGCWLYD